MRSLFRFRFSAVLLLILCTWALIACGGGSTQDNNGALTPVLSQPVIDSFTANPDHLVAGSGVTSLLSWQVQRADSLSIAPTVGTVSVPSGSATISPSGTTQYTLTAENSAGSITAVITVTVGTSDLAGTEAHGDLPAGLPPRLAVGLVEEPGDTWMLDSGVAWDMRYHYFTKGWRNNWGWDPENNGSWGKRWMDECDAHGFIPVIQYYCMNDEPGGAEDQFFNKAGNAQTMASYFDDFKVLMQRAKEFDKPVLVLLEADGFAFMQRQSNDDPHAYAAIAASGVPELGGLPDSAAGWGLAFLQIRKAVGAHKVILGMHISAWASANDISYFQTDLPLQPEVDKVYAFLSVLGLAQNLTDETYDVLVGDPLDRDSDFYRITQGQNRWWDPGDNAPIDSSSFNRYAEWMKLWNRKAGKRWVLWQIPLGNSNHLNVPNDGSPRAGYQDNRAEYFFANGTAHLRKFADAGTIALLFGPGSGGQSYHTNDVYTDGELFMHSRAGDLLNAGGLPIATSGQ